MAVSCYHAGRFWKERINYDEFLVNGSFALGLHAASVLEYEGFGTNQSWVFYSSWLWAAGKALPWIPVWRKEGACRKMLQGLIVLVLSAETKPQQSVRVLVWAYESACTTAPPSIFNEAHVSPRKLNAWIYIIISSQPESPYRAVNIFCLINTKLILVLLIYSNLPPCIDTKPWNITGNTIRTYCSSTSLQRIRRSQKSWSSWMTHTAFVQGIHYPQDFDVVAYSWICW